MTLFEKSFENLSKRIVDTRGELYRMFFWATKTILYFSAQNISFLIFYQQREMGHRINLKWAKSVQKD